MEIIPEPEWEALFDTLFSIKGTVVIIGETDSGKSTLAKYLLQKCVSRNVTACLIDADVGQSSLGIPGTVCMKAFSTVEDLQAYNFEKMSFIGTVNPAKNINYIINAVKKIAETCRSRSTITLVDTSGLVAGEIGEKLKIMKVRALNPDHVIAIQKQDELEHILCLISERRIHRINPSKNIKSRPLSARVQYRKSKYSDYFRKNEMTDFILYTHEATFLFRNKVLTIREGAFKKGTLLGLNHDDDTIALGILEDISDKSITFLSPLNSLSNINRVIFGDITYSSD